MKDSTFVNRHLGLSDADISSMLDYIGVKSLDQLLDEAIPKDIRLNSFNLDESLSEQDYLSWIKQIASQNKLFRSFIGQGFYNSFLPSVIGRNILENPGFYTQYTPYQPEISQGRLEALIAFQTMVKDLSAMEVANASLLDEASAAAEAMQMAFRIVLKTDHSPTKCKFFVDDKCFRSTIDVLKTRANHIGIELVIGDVNNFIPDKDFFAGLLQTPNNRGTFKVSPKFCQGLHEHGALAIVGCDLLSLTLFTPPGEWGADIVYGNTQRFGLPLNYGGPHAAFFATKMDFIREVPGRVVGVVMDEFNRPTYRLSLQTREQHIKKDRATSNICTAQTLLAIIASAYACYHGPVGLKKIATKIKSNTDWLKHSLKKLGFTVLSGNFFDTISVQLTSLAQGDDIIAEAIKRRVNFFRISPTEINISLDETVTAKDLNLIYEIFSGQGSTKSIKLDNPLIDDNYKRKTKFLTHHVFNSYHSETEMLRYLKYLENKDLSLANAMIPLGSCTMKLNSTSSMLPISWPEIKDVHPYAPLDQALGYKAIFESLGSALLKITGFAEISFQPNSGAQGEFAGLGSIKGYLKSIKQEKRNVVLIPTSSHGTNPASAAMCGFKVIFVNCDANGNVDIEDIKQKVIVYKDVLACLMITYPSTHGIFEKKIPAIIDIIHSAGGQIYMDGANMNAQVGLTSPQHIKADVCHLNLHKTFGIPHGGGGPGAGPILVAKHLAPFLPQHHFNSPNGISQNCVAATPWGSAAILVVPLGYIKLLGGFGCQLSSKISILNANYMLKRLAKYISPLYTNENGWVAHEFILDTRIFKKQANINVMDIAKRLLDYGFHPPTISFPVAGTLMIEPTESESKNEIDRFCDALISITKEIADIAKNKELLHDNLLKNAPHTIENLTQDDWAHPYSRNQAVFPVEELRKRKFWPSTNRINEAWGDRNLKCDLP
ncbi:MAG: aminomethyl-transferring glycine dehydrogenase [SAR324 cluster bacterium]|nr:aminomethyl-transferring glycine dehydrogenase [SAR324 cluster bacterium]